MGGVTIAHQPVSATEAVEDSYYPTDTETTDENQQYNQLLAAAAAAAAVASNEQWSESMPSVEDLTGEVQELLMRESMNSWLQPWMTENASCIAELDNQMYAQSIQLEDLFGQDEMALSPNTIQQSLYDEVSFVPEDISLTMSAPTSSASSPNTSAQISPVASPIAADIQIDDQEELLEKLENQVNAFDMTKNMKRRRGSTSSEDSSDDSSSDEDDESGSEHEDVIIPTTVANLNSRRRMSYSSDSDSDSEPTFHRQSRASSPVTNPYMYMHKRQIEETLLERITNSLNPEKLPGILSILASEKPNTQQEDEVEIDLSCLARDQLVQILFYVDACILEQNGGPAVNIEDFVMKKQTKKDRSVLKNEEKSKQAKSRRPRRPRQPRTKTRAELTEDLDIDSSFSESEELNPLSVDNVVNLNGPISMASLTKKNKSTRPSTSTKGGRRRQGKAKRYKNRRKSEDDDDVSSSIAVFQDPHSIASTRPKRRAAVHKRRLLEQMLAPSDNESEEDAEDGVLVVYSDEKMDFNVVDNQTIAHTTTPIPVPPSKEEIVMSATKTEDDEDTDEEIDIMC
jgi:hypothetical protein